MAGAGALASLLLTRLLPPLWVLKLGESPSLARVCLLAALALGAAFPLLLATLPSGHERAAQAQPAQAIGRFYGLEALDSAAGWALFAVLLVPACPPLMVVLLAALALTQAGPWDRALRQAQWAGRMVMAVSETPYFQLLATSRGGQADIFASGLWLLSHPESQARQTPGAFAAAGPSSGSARPLLGRGRGAAQIARLGHLLSRSRATCRW